MANSAGRILLVDPSEERRAILVRRLGAQGYEVDEASDGAEGAEMALSAPPSAVIANLAMPSVSGLQLCRMLRSEPATSDVPVILSTERDAPRNHFWAEHAGASACVVAGRTGELLRTLRSVVTSKRSEDGFFVHLGDNDAHLRDRIARHLDAALVESVICGELRALTSASTFEGFFDQLSQLLVRLTRYRWIALATVHPARYAIHAHARRAAAAETEARQALGIAQGVPIQRIEDEDAAIDERGPEAVVREVVFGGKLVARLAFAPVVDNAEDDALLMDTVAREIGGAVRMTGLVEELERAATIDSLTGLLNRKAFALRLQAELARCARHGYPLSLALLDVDHFKQINDRHGHTAGDRVLQRLGTVVANTIRTSDFAARWGGEELIVVYTSTEPEASMVAAERLRAAIESIVVDPGTGTGIRVTASIGVAFLSVGEALESLVDRADLAMYTSKRNGRNRVSTIEPDLESIARTGAVGRSAA